MTARTTTPGQRIAYRFLGGYCGWPWEREFKLAQAIDRAIKAARKDARAEVKRLREENARLREAVGGGR